MTIVAFDTHKYVKRLTAAGMPENQAEVIADEQRSLIEDQLATKRDIEELRAVTKRDIEELKAATKRDIKELEAATKQDIAATRRDIKELEITIRRDMKEMEQKLTIRFGVMMAASVAVISALVKIL